MNRSTSRSAHCSLAALLVLSACRASTPAVVETPPAPPTPPATVPIPPSKAGIIDEAAIDRSVNPCDDFYQFACGGWLKATPIPADRAQWTRSFSEIAERNINTERDILEKAAAAKAATDDAGARKLGDFYATCMDEGKAETASLAALKERLATVAKLKDAKGLATLLASLQTAGVGALFDIGQQQDFKDATQVIADVDQGGTALPDVDYYTKDDDKSVELRKQYVAHISRMLELAGDKPADAAKAAQWILEFETALAEVSMRRPDRREPANVYHRLERAGLKQKAPHFEWDTFFAGLGLPSVTAINVVAPDFFGGLDKLLVKHKVADLKPYLRWHVVHAYAGTLGKAFVEEDFAFMGKRLTGAAELKPRWKRCVEATERALGFVLGQQFVALTFGEEGKARTQEMLDRILTAFRQNVATLTWMDDPTKAASVEKLEKFARKIGYPDQWRKYDALQIDRGSWFANAVRANDFEARRQLDKIGKPVDRGEWLMTPPTVNAYYEPSLNEMVFPAGILQPPFFNRDAGDCTNYGAIGMVIGHELTHGFDDEGRKFDGSGNLRDWWAPEVGRAFEERAACVNKQYSGYVAVDDKRLDGKLTLGENIADLGGLKLAYMALQASKATRAPAATAAGFTEEQQFFLAHAQGWCTNRRDEEARRRVVTDPHSPPRFRVNGVVVNLPEFAEAFQCKEGSKMAPLERCTVW